MEEKRASLVFNRGDEASGTEWFICDGEYIVYDSVASIASQRLGEVEHRLVELIYGRWRDGMATT